MADSYELALPGTFDSEKDEVRLAKLRDEGAWSLWYDRYFPTLYRYALARTRSREEAEDIASLAFVRALEGIDRYDYRGRPVLAWLYRITHNLVADRIRRARRRPAVALAGSGSELAAEHEGLPRVELLDALSRLGKDQREVVVLRYLTALSLRETAAAMGKTEAAVYSLQVRAISNLRRTMKD